VLSWIRVDGFGGDEGCPPKRDARRVEMESATSGVLLPASFAWPLSIFWVCEGSIPNPPNRVVKQKGPIPYSNWRRPYMGHKNKEQAAWIFVV
jgi:hypothetical protein